MTDKIFAQGELTIINLAKLTAAERKKLGSDVPADARKVQRGGVLVVGHSETGHHHVIESPCAELFETSDPLVCYLRLEAPATLKHLRGYHTHAPHVMEAGTYRVHRQRERGPAGWRQVQD